MDVQANNSLVAQTHGHCAGFMREGDLMVNVATQLSEAGVEEMSRASKKTW